MAANGLEAHSDAGRLPIGLAAIEAVLVDLDGVVTETARIHAEAWKSTFDDYLEERAAGFGSQFEPFDLGHDYKRYVDGKPRYDGVADFLQSRHIFLPRGREDDSPETETICGLGNKKNQRYLEAIRQDGVQTYETSIDFIEEAKAHGLKVAVVTSSQNCHEVLQAAGIAELFDAEVDGRVAAEWMLEGKPAPDVFLEAARRLGVRPENAAVIEDATSGVEAGRAGHFGLVIGVDRSGRPELLRSSGADIVVSDLSELHFDGGVEEAPAAPPSALDKLAHIRQRIGNRRLAVFLDYDGTLTPIVERPELAILSGDMRETLQTLVDCCPVIIISGRDRRDVEHLVSLEGIIYAGCHGFDISGPPGTNIQHEEGRSYVPEIKAAAEALRQRLDQVEGILLEDKTYALAVHFRLVPPEKVDDVEVAVNAVLEQHRGLRKTGGKKIFELRPDIDWDKGRAVLWLLDVLGLEGDEIMPFYIGDDVTDHDAFKALRGKGISLLVSEEAEAGGGADYRLRDTREVRRFLEALAAMCRGRAP
mgnify:FL=1|jgi:alpha,alpha-trehalase